jgi:hypothetical protein
MTQHIIYLNEQEKDKVKMLQMNFKLRSVNEVVKFLLREYQIRVDDRGFLEPDKSEKNVK